MRKGFSLIEIMVVIVIIGILSTFVGMNVFSAVDDANESKARTEMSTIKTAVKRYRMKRGKFPQSLKELVPKYIEDEEGFMDPWDKDYVLKVPGRKKQSFEVFSCGPDGIEGNDDDVTLSKKEASKDD